MFSDLPEEEYSQKLFCNTVNTILQEFLENCVILVDDQGYVLKDVKVFLEKWPIKSRIRAKSLIKELNKKNRFLGSRPLVNESPTVRHSSCRYLYAFMMDHPLTPVIAGNGCCISSCSHFNTVVRKIDVADYGDSDFSQSRRKTQNLILSWGEWSKGEFEKEILVPVLQNSKHVKIFDRYIGRSVQPRKKKSSKPYEPLRESYEKSLEWILEVFSRETKHRAERTFEIHTGVNIDDSFSEEKVSEMRNYLRKIKDDMNTKYDFPIKLIVKKEKSKQEGTELKPEFSHSRHLITDQVGILVDRGFDLLWDNKEMENAKLDPSSDEYRLRDVVVSLITHPEKIERETRKLPDL